MLADEFGGNPYNKAEHNRNLQQIINRPRSAIEFKHQNISAVLKALGEIWIDGYKPLFNYQASLEEAVVAWLDGQTSWLDRPAQEASATGLGEAEPLWIGPPPTLSNQPPPDELEKAQATARKFDVAGRDERNRKLGKAGEKFILAHEKSTLALQGRKDLAEAVRWVSQEDGDGAGYDIASFTKDGDSRLIEVKTTNGWERTPFHISRNELAVADARSQNWHLLRLWDFSRKPRAFELTPPLEGYVSLTPTSFQASFG